MGRGLSKQHQHLQPAVFKKCGRLYLNLPHFIRVIKITHLIINHKQSTNKYVATHTNYLFGYSCPIIGR